MTLANRRVLYISYNGMLDPLGQSQVIPCLKELSSQTVLFHFCSVSSCAATLRMPDGLDRCAELGAD